MMLSILIIFFLCCMIWMWANQGVFSAFIHLVLTIIAGCIAFAFWEPFVFGFLINRMPEQAWGMGLLIPFAVSLIVLRTVVDKLVPGNLIFPPIADNIGGAVLGYCSGVLTAGLLVIGLQMVGLPSLFGHQGWAFDASSGQLTRKDSLLIPVDSVAGSFFTYLSAGSMNPVIGSSSLAVYHPDPAREASLFHQSPFWTQGHDSSLRALPPANAKSLEKDGYFELSTGEVPRVLKTQGVQLKPNEHLIVVGTEVINKSKDGTVAADSEGRFRIARGQVALVDDSGHYYHPIGYIQAQTYVSFKDPATFAYSDTSGSVTHHWVFVAPTGVKPHHLVLKQTRIALPAQSSSEGALVDSLITPAERIVADDGGGGDPGTEQGGGGFVSLYPSLGVAMNKNALTDPTINFKDAALVSGEFRYIPNRERDRGLDKDLVVATVYHDAGSKVVRVSLGSKGDRNSLLSKIVKFANQSDPPELLSQDNKRYQAIGYVRQDGNSYYVRINPNNKIRAMSELKLGEASDSANVTLFFHVDLGKTITSVVIGKNTLNPEPLSVLVR